MTVYLVGAGPGDPGLLTVRGAELLARADVVLYDRLSVASLLDLAPDHAELIPVGKTPRGPSTPQDDINALMIEHGRAGRTVVRLKGGDPFVFARGGEEALALAQAGVDFEVVPGISSAIAAPAYAGVPVTYRGLATSFTVVTGHEDPWSSTETDWTAVAHMGCAGGTIVVLMGSATRAEIARRLMAGGLAGDTPVVAVSWGTRPDQHTARTTLARLGDTEVGSTAAIVIGAVAGLPETLDWFERRPLFGRRIAITRAREQASELRRRLEALGAEVIEVPTIRIVDAADGGAGLRAAAAELGSYDWVAFTSANAVERLLACLVDARSFGTAKVAAIGPGTAASLAAAGVVADLVAERSVGEGLADAFPSGSGRVLVPQAAAARPVVAEGLRAKGWTVDAVEAYRTESLPVGDDDAAKVAKADAVVFTASSTVFDVPAGPAVVAMGPITAAAARERGLTVSAIAEPHTLDGLVAALVGLFS